MTEEVEYVARVVVERVGPVFVSAMQQLAKAAQPLVEAIREMEKNGQLTDDEKAMARGYAFALEMRAREDRFMEYKGDPVAARDDEYARYARDDDIEKLTK